MGDPSSFEAPPDQVGGSQLRVRNKHAAGLIRGEMKRLLTLRNLAIVVVLGAAFGFAVFWIVTILSLATAVYIAYLMVFYAARRRRQYASEETSDHLGA